MLLLTNMIVPFSYYRMHPFRLLYLNNQDILEKCITRIPYASLIALIMSWTGVGVFCGTLYRGVNLTLRMLQDVFHLDKGLGWIEPTQIAFIILASTMAAIALMILCITILTTKTTRQGLHQSTIGRNSAKLICIIFIGITYILLILWLIKFAACIVTTVFYTLSWGLCDTDEIAWEDGFIDFYPFHFLFPNGTGRSYMEVRGTIEIKQFCKDYVEHAEIMFLLACFSSFIVILSLVHFLMTLSSNFAHIHNYSKFRNIHEITCESMILADKDLYPKI
ncbi:neuronal membrane glycoprotein M6-b isoform X3 [Lepeophtheirus salmonis]|uniref:neuronal membrane glycoprotein M6-b isoform X3 n=2 Tax=Lepeophtheirus salmonis TaxID=72036 RepID=UPI003AF34061